MFQMVFQIPVSGHVSDTSFTPLGGQGVSDDVSDPCLTRVSDDVSGVDSEGLLHTRFRSDLGVWAHTCGLSKSMKWCPISW